MKTGDCITHEVTMAMERVARAFKAYREEPSLFGRMYQAKREELDKAITELLRTTGTRP